MGSAIVRVGNLWLLQRMRPTCCTDWETRCSFAAGVSRWSHVWVGPSQADIQDDFHEFCHTTLELDGSMFLCAGQDEIERENASLFSRRRVVNALGLADERRDFEAHDLMSPVQGT